MTQTMTQPQHGNIGMGTVTTGQVYTSGAGVFSASTITNATINANTINPTSYIGSGYQSNLIFNSSNNQEIVRLNADGTITWANGYQVDEAAEHFGKMLKVGAEMAVGITARVKRDMRDSVFEDLIEIAKSKGALSAEDLTYLLNASKIVEKLKGGK